MEGLATGNITKATWNQIGSICFNGFVNKDFLPFFCLYNHHIAIHACHFGYLM